MKSATTDFEIVRGAVEVEIEYRNGEKDRIEIRELPIKLLDRWAQFQGDEASLVELYCDKLDITAVFKMRGLAAEEQALMKRLTRPFIVQDGKATQPDPDWNPPTLEEEASIRKRLGEVQEEILNVEATERWDDTLTPESHDRIFEWGEKINRPRYERWVKNSREAIAHLQGIAAKMLNGNQVRGSENLSRTSRSLSAPTAKQEN